MHAPCNAFGKMLAPHGNVPSDVTSGMTKSNIASPKCLFIGNSLGKMSTPIKIPLPSNDSVVSSFLDCIGKRLFDV